jgi:hypothetical protein
MEKWLMQQVKSQGQGRYCVNIHHKRHCYTLVMSFSHVDHQRDPKYVQILNTVAFKGVTFVLLC